MNVASILAAKGSDVVTVAPDQSLAAIVSMLADKKIGAIVVVESGGPVCGIISERDVVRQIATSGAGALDQPVSVCMTRKVISCTAASSVDEVMGLMTRGKFRHIPVIEGGRLAGIVSIGDVVKRKIEHAEREAEELKQYIAG
ncbi:MAG: CBS domain-containing protein [Nitratireductor sp.]|nr:CBS domain-containing protein [Nitratireductor sp.]